MNNLNDENTPRFTCEKHGIELLKPFSSGAGFCPKCNLWIQAAGVDMPPLDEWVQAKRDAAAKPKRKRKTKTTKTTAKKGKTHATKTARKKPTRKATANPAIQ